MHGATAAWLADFTARERLPADFGGLIDQLYGPLATHLEMVAGRRPGMAIVGLCGPQGSGKSTGTSVLCHLLEARGLRVAALSLDDLYLTRAARADLARRVHPLCATRGPPGTHDIGLGLSTVDSLRAGCPTALPRFDKASDDRVPEAAWDIVEARPDVLLFEGWCVGAIAEPPDSLTTPINTLERDEDGQGVWRRYANAALMHDYPALFDQIDTLILFRAPDFATIGAWREEQEAKLRVTSPRGPDQHVMTPAAVARFVQLFERTTVQIDREMPQRADAVITLDSIRRPTALHVAHRRLRP